MAKILLLGGTGAIGKYVSNYCTALGHKVFITSRSKRVNEDDNVTYICGDATEFEFVSSIISKQSFDAIIDFMVYKTNEFNQRIDSILNCTGHYIFLSSYRVFCDSGLRPLTEDSPQLLDNCRDGKYLKTDEYALAKARQEDALFNNNKRNWTIVRPSITYAADRFQLGTLEANVILPRAVLNIPVILPSEMMNLYTTMTWAGDVGKMISLLLFKHQCMGNDFNVTTDEKYTWEGVAKIYHDLIGLDVIKVPIKDYMTLGLNPFQIKYDRLYNRICNNKKILEASGIEKKTLKNLKNGLALELSRTNFSGYSSLTRIHGRMDKILGINRVGKAIQKNKLINYLAGYVPISNKLYNMKNW